MNFLSTEDRLAEGACVFYQNNGEAPIGSQVTLSTLAMAYKERDMNEFAPGGDDAEKIYCGDQAVIFVVPRGTREARIAIMADTTELLEVLVEETVQGISAATDVIKGWELSKDYSAEALVTPMKNT